MSNFSSANVVVPIASDDATEGTVNLTSLTFTPQNWNVQQTITVRGVDDQVSDGDIIYQVLVGPSTSTVDAYNDLTGAVTLTNYDNEPVGQYVGTFNGYTMDYASFPPGVLKDTVTADIQVTITGGNGTLLDPYTGTVTEQGTLVITVVQQNPGGTLFGDTIGANGAGPISGSWGNVAGHIDGVADNDDPFTVNFTNGMFVGDQIWATVTVDLGLAGVAPIVSNVQLARQH